MKKLKYSFLMAILGLMFVAMPVMASEIQVVVDGKTVQFPDQKPFINKDNRVLVPVRAPMEVVRAHIFWAPASQRARITKGNKTVAFTIGSKAYTINGHTKQMDTEAQLAGGRTVFPLFVL